MKPVNYLLVFILLFSIHLSHAHETSVEQLVQKNIPDIVNQEAIMLTVTYPPGEKSEKHKHNAHTFVYVLEGSVIMQVEGSERVTLKKGESFYETPNDIHTVSMNASTTDEAKILVFFIKPTGTPLVEPVAE